MQFRQLPRNAAHWVLIQARSVVLKSPRFSDWLAARIRRFPWLYLKLVAAFSENVAREKERPLVVPVLTPATREVLHALRHEMARATARKE